MKPLKLSPVVEQQPDRKPLSQIELLPLRPPATLLARLERKGLEEGTVCYCPGETEFQKESREIQRGKSTESEREKTLGIERNTLSISI